MLDQSLVGRVRESGKSLSFLKGKKGDGITDTVLDEAVAEWMEVETLRTRNGESSNLKSIINENFGAIAGSKGTMGKMKAFARAMKKFFEVALMRNLYIKKAIRDGVVDKKDIESFRAKLQGTSQQEEHMQEVGAEYKDQYESDFVPTDNEPFSLGYNNFDSGVNLPYKKDNAYRGVKRKIQGLAGKPTRGTLESLREWQENESRRENISDEGERLKSEAKSLLSWAKQNGRIIDSKLLGERLGQFKQLEGGEEHFVYDDAESGRVIKLTYKETFGHHKSSVKYLDNVKLSNDILGDDIRFEGVVELDNGVVSIVVSQPFIKGSSPRFTEIFKWFSDIGFRGEGNKYRSDELGLTITDAHPGNFMKAEDGDLYPIDVLFEVDEVLEGMNESESFSLGNSAIADALIGDVTKRVRDPLKRAEVLGKIAKNVESLKREVDEHGVAFGKAFVKPALVEPRTKKSLKKESAMRQALREEELVNEAMAQSDFALDRDQDFETKILSMPVHGYLSNGKLTGSLMSESEALKSVPDFQEDSSIRALYDEAYPCVCREYALVKITSCFADWAFLRV